MKFTRSSSGTQRMYSQFVRFVRNQLITLSVHDSSDVQPIFTRTPNEQPSSIFSRICPETASVQLPWWKLSEPTCTKALTQGRRGYVIKVSGKLWALDSVTQLTPRKLFDARRSCRQHAPESRLILHTSVISMDYNLIRRLTGLNGKKKSRQSTVWIYFSSAMLQF